MIKNIFYEKNWDIEEYPPKISNSLYIYIDFNNDGTCNLITKPKDKSILLFNIKNKLFNEMKEDDVKNIILHYYNSIKQLIDSRKKLLIPIKIRTFKSSVCIDKIRRNHLLFYTTIHYTFKSLDFMEFLWKSDNGSLIDIYYNNDLILFRKHLIISEKINIFNIFWKIKKFKKKVNNSINYRKNIYNKYIKDVKDIIIEYE